jgi:hypothetical protein
MARGIGVGVVVMGQVATVGVAVLGAVLATGSESVTGDKSGTTDNDAAARPGSVPADWTQKSSKKGGGTIYQNPANPHESVRVMPGNPTSPNPAQRGPYVKHMRDGQALDSTGNPVAPDSPEAHIPLDQYR